MERVKESGVSIFSPLDLDPATGLWSVVSGDDHVSTQHDRLGRTLSQTDQRGVAHLYLYDSAGRLRADVADLDGLLPGQHCDDSVLAVVTAYDDTGRVQSVTSRGGDDLDLDGLPDDVVNQVAYRYDAWGNLAQEWQAHHGEVDNDGQGDDSPSVEYIYSDGLNPASTGNPAPHVRLVTVVYPNGRRVEYDYGTGADPDDPLADPLSRLSAIRDGGTTILDSAGAQQNDATLLYDARIEDGALTLDGDSTGAVVVADSATGELDIYQGDFSFAAWIYRNADGQSEYLLYKAESLHASSRQYAVYVTWNGRLTLGGSVS